MAAEIVVFERPTSNGLLSIRFAGRQMRVYLGGERYLGITTIDKLPRPAVIGGTTYSHAIGGRFALTSSEVEAINVAQIAVDRTLEGRREILAEAVLLSDSGAFPGSAAWRKAKVAIDKLTAFDAEHPEILAATQAAKKGSMGYVGKL